MYIECGERPVPVVKFEIVAEGSGYFSSEAASWSGGCVSSFQPPPFADSRTRGRKTSNASLLPRRVPQSIRDPVGCITEICFDLRLSLYHIIVSCARTPSERGVTVLQTILEGLPS
jgi:hypothetical protein